MLGAEGHQISDVCPKRFRIAYGISRHKHLKLCNILKSNGVSVIRAIGDRDHVVQPHVSVINNLKGAQFGR